MQNTKDILRSLSVLTDVSASRNLNLDEKLQRILLAVVRCMGTENGSIMTVSGRKFLVVRAATHSKLIGARQPLSHESPSAWVFKHKKTLYMDRNTQDPELAMRFPHYKKEAFLVAPIIVDNKIVGVINVTDKMGEDRFDSQEQRLLISFAGQIIGALENHRLTASLQRRKRELEKKNRRLAQLEKTQKDLFNMLIHDLKGPLTNIVANIDILSYTVDEENREYVASAQEGCDALYRMTSDLLDIARLEEGGVQLIYENLHADELIRDALSRIHGIARAKSVALIDGVSENQYSPVIQGDRGMLQRVLQNLLINAIHHSQDGMAVEVTYETLGDNQVSFCVKDDGPGVPPEFHSLIFDKFFQAKKVADGRIYSTGLGLSFCKLAIDAHKGRIFVESDGKCGSRFTFILPVQ
ncbi:MAG: GAF domain-containing protein [Deltaproteobacteria bacterium]|nr:GAF domain-containing protein [Deltaproteobacteria bacterium]